MEFFKLSKALKLYPSIVPLETLKKVVLKSPDYWGTSASPVLDKSPEKQNAAFLFKDFVSACRIISRIGYKEVNLKDGQKFVLLSQYLQKQFATFSSQKAALQPINCDLTEMVDTNSTKGVLPDSTKFMKRQAPNTNYGRSQYSSQSTTKIGQSKNVATRGLLSHLESAPQAYSAVNLKNQISQKQEQDYSTVNQQVDSNRDYPLWDAQNIPKSVLQDEIINTQENEHFKQINTHLSDSIENQILKNSLGSQNRKVGNVADSAQFSSNRSSQNQPHGSYKGLYERGRSIASVKSGKSYKAKGQFQNDNIAGKVGKAKRKKSQANTSVHLHQQLRNNNLRAVYAQSQVPFRHVTIENNRQYTSVRQMVGPGGICASQSINTRALKIKQSSSTTNSNNVVNVKLHLRKGSVSKSIEGKSPQNHKVVPIKKVSLEHSQSQAHADNKRYTTLDNEKPDTQTSEKGNLFRIRKYSRSLSQRGDFSDQREQQSLSAQKPAQEISGSALSKLKQTIDSDEDNEERDNQNLKDSKETEQLLRRRRSRQQNQLSDTKGSQKERSESRTIGKIEILDVTKHQKTAANSRPEPEQKKAAYAVSSTVSERESELESQNTKLKEQLSQANKDKRQLVCFINMFKQKVDSFKEKHRQIIDQ